MRVLNFAWSGISYGGEQTVRFKEGMHLVFDDNDQLVVNECFREETPVNVVNGEIVDICPSSSEIPT